MNDASINIRVTVTPDQVRELIAGAMEDGGWYLTSGESAADIPAGLIEAVTRDFGEYLPLSADEWIRRTWKVYVRGSYLRDAVAEWEHEQDEAAWEAAAIGSRMGALVGIEGGDDLSRCEDRPGAQVGNAVLSLGDKRWFNSAVSPEQRPGGWGARAGWRPDRGAIVPIMPARTGR